MQENSIIFDYEYICVLREKPNYYKFLRKQKRLEWLKTCRHVIMKRSKQSFWLDNPAGWYRVVSPL
jgi:hypothetical protein